MDRSDLLKKIEALEKRLTELESEKKDSRAMFGRSYNQVGDSNSDFIIKTKGQIKIQWGNKFIDLIKDGKINVDAQFIYKESSVGSRDGIYVIENGDSTEVWVVVGGQQINLIGEVGNTYVSFLAPQDSTPDQKHQALENIGFFYKDISAVDNSGITSGIIYVEAEKKLFIVEDGTLTEFTISIPNPFTEQFVIAKASDSKGAIVIQGQGINNSLAFNGLYIYAEDGQAVFDSQDNLCMKVGDKDIMVLSSVSAQFLTKVISQSFESRDADSSFGFRLYMDNGTSILEVDKLVVRQGTSDLTILYPQYWLGQNSIIRSVKAKEASSETQQEPSESEDVTISEFELTLNQEATFNEGDTLVVYLQEESSMEITDSKGETYTDTIVQLNPIELEVTKVSQISYTDSAGETKTVSNTINVKSTSMLTLEQAQSLARGYIYKIISSDQTFNPLRLKGNTLDIVQYGSISGEAREETIKTRIGDLSGIEGTEGYGIYTDNLRVGGNDPKNFPRYIDSLKTLLDSSDIKETDSYDTVFTPIGTLKLFFKDITERIEKLENRVSLVENDLASMKDDIYTMQQDIESLKNPPAPSA